MSLMTVHQQKKTRSGAVANQQAAVVSTAAKKKLLVPNEARAEWAMSCSLALSESASATGPELALVNKLLAHNFSHDRDWNFTLVLRIVRSCVTEAAESLDGARWEARCRVSLVKCMTLRDKVGISSRVISPPSEMSKFKQVWDFQLLGFEHQVGLVCQDSIGKVNPAAVKTLSGEQIARCYSHQLRVLEHMYNLMSLRDSVRRYKLVLLFDLDGLNTKHLHMLDITKRICMMFQDMFPESVHQIQLCSSPLLFQVAWRTLKSVLHPETVAKIKVTASSPRQIIDGCSWKLEQGEQWSQDFAALLCSQELQVQPDFRYESER